MRISMSKAATVAALTVGSTVAMAHTGHEHTSSFMSGFLHPMGGLDHLLAMVAVGLWAASMGGRALWAVPMAFVAMMLLGGGAAMAGLEVPFVEQGILLSVMVLGALVLGAKRLPVAACAAIAGGFAVFHGVAHGMEMPANGAAAQYALGFAVATTALHLVGVGFGQLMARLGTPLVTRISGSVIAVLGMVLAIA
ncbi:MAG: urease accessory protein UreJ [Marinomonas sp.]|uniref:Urease accessory protein n=1 Tax=Marinomonas communis TaxID=28254 RepID=A0A4R6X4W6_9GAMM|nr:HupE/UreJ family protein [Marinomonas communis]MAF15945.1 urease accessory protein UreJ [Marinomonas sp.]MEC8081994.1 HupE/UreJ family protein [Pseudomonadota bacterium]MCC4273615.1 HupE/UreJ family protein [Marinomonas communis]MEC8484335.1 HupE/UreJ family protein [Pseudomonadota bacterium]RUM48426.1 MAG: urease accessory protein UreJ [Marinomonas sp.]